jgi:ATP-dependent exoDNAse (exonuclease V) beta subunit
MSKLTVYSASAGSGKTFILAVEYIKLLFKSRHEYRHILAVTFTNKATAEMKARIIRELNNLAINEPSPATDRLMKEIDLPPEQIIREAEVIRDYLLHDYSRFSVGTIDNFFQRILTSFARETGLQFGFNLELDNKRILEQAVDNLMDNLDGKSKLTDWLIRFAENRVEEGKNWNFRDSLIDLGKEIFSENYQGVDDKYIQDGSDSFLNKLNEYQNSLHKIIRLFENAVEKFGNEGLDIISEHGLEIEDFKHGSSSVPRYFWYLAERDRKKFTPRQRDINAIDNPYGWVKDTSEKKNEIIAAVDGGLNEVLKRAIEFYNKNFREYFTAVSINNNLFSFGILADIEQQIREITHNDNLFLLSDVPGFLNKIINGNEAPFIYEKTGNHFKYFMIDEFQDTSTIQWENFKPLIINSISEGYKNMVVGDIKQSIYRWRNSDWNILASLIAGNQNVFDVDKRSLKENWRSKRNIVDFNNRLFEAAKKLLDDLFVSGLQENGERNQNIKGLGIDTTISGVFSDHIQVLPGGEDRKGGYIEISFIDPGKEKWESKVLEKLPVLVNDLLDKGLRPGEIAILVRKKDQAVKVMESLLSYMNNDKEHRKTYNLISDDSLFIRNSGAVKFLLGMLRYFLNPDDDINNSWLLYYLNKKDKLTRKDDGESELFEENDRSARLISILPVEFRETLYNLKNLPLFELTENLIRIFKLNTIEDEIPFIQAFQDLVIEYSKTEFSGIMQFMEWWEQTGIEKSIQLSEKLDAVRVITLHKAKGLQFRSVIIPFCNWKIDHEINPMIWCEPKTAPFNKLDRIPVKYVKNLALTEFDQDYFREKFYTFIDNLNLLYVAFTRAMDSLFVMCPPPPVKSGGLTNMGHLVREAINYCAEASNTEMKNQGIDFSKFRDTEKEVFQIGINEISKDIPVKIGLGEMAVKTYPSNKYSAKLRFNLQADDYFEPAAMGERSRVNYGKIMHEIFENITTLKDIESSLKKLVYAGKISNDETTAIRNNIFKKLENEQVKDWFSDKWKVKAEADILLKDGKIKRPDRVIYNDEKTVVIDYKFGEIKESKHRSQIRQYMNYLSEMGYKRIEGYLWYVEMDEVIKV